MEQKPQGVYELRLRDQVTMFTSQRAAVKAFRDLRLRLEQELPPHEPSIEERQALLHKVIADSIVRHNSLRDAGPRQRTGTRTFG